MDEELRTDLTLFAPLLETAVFGLLYGCLRILAARTEWNATRQLAVAAADHEVAMLQLPTEAPVKPEPIVRAAARIATHSIPSGNVLWAMRKYRHLYEALVTPTPRGFLLRFVLDGDLQSYHHFDDRKGVKLGDLATAKRDELLAHGWQDIDGGLS